MRREPNTGLAFSMAIFLAMGIPTVVNALVPPKDPLLMAVLVGDEKEVKRLIYVGADVNKVDERYGCTALHLAAREGHLEMVKMLRKAGAKIYAYNTKKESLVFAAAYSGSTNVFKFLLDEGATTRSRNSDGETVLQHAIAFRKLDMAKYLVQIGLDVNTKDKRGFSPMHTTAYVGDVAIVDDLRRAGADVNSTNWHKETPLHLAAVYDHTNCLQELLKAGANPNMRDDEGSTPLSYAKSPTAVDLLLKAKADPNIADSSKYTPLSGVVVRNAGISFVKLLVQGGADINKRIDHERTAIFNAIPDDNVDVFRFLVENGADLSVKDDDGETPLDWIQQYNARRIKAYLDERARASKAK